MKVLYDHQIFQHQRFGGVSRYFAEIMKNLPSDVDWDVSIKYTFNEYLKDLNLPGIVWQEQLAKDAHFLEGMTFRGKKRLFSYAERMFPSKYPDFLQMNQQQTLERIKSQDFDIFHPTFFDDYYLDLLKGKPYVLTVHDMIFELYPEFVNSIGHVKKKKKLMDGAAHLIAVSENTKQDIINIYGIDSDKVSVIHHASSLTEQECEIQGLPESYLLYVGDRRMGYKNFKFLLSSIRSILLENKDLFLVCTGDGFSFKEGYYISQLDLTDKVITMFVSDKQMYSFYQKARMFIYPSYYEGFGIPILEAFQAHCPIVLPNASCFPEVAADAGCYFSPKSPTDLRKRVDLLLNDVSYREEQIKKGTGRLRDFSWQTSAEKTLEVYKKVLEK